MLHLMIAVSFVSTSYSTSGSSAGHVNALAVDTNLAFTELTCTGSYYKITARQTLANGTQVDGEWCMNDHRGPNKLTSDEAAGLQFATLDRSPRMQGEVGPYDLYGVIRKGKGSMLNYTKDGDLEMVEVPTVRPSPRPNVSETSQRWKNGFQWVPYDDSRKPPAEQRLKGQMVFAE